MNLKRLKILRSRAYRAPIVAAFITLLGGAFFYHFVEEWSWLDSFYFSVITLTTVGYGDMAPQTDIGKVFTMVYLITGIGIIFGFINAFHQNRLLAYNKILEEDKKRRNKRKENNK